MLCAKGALHLTQNVYVAHPPWRYLCVCMCVLAHTHFYARVCCDTGHRSELLSLLSDAPVVDFSDVVAMGSMPDHSVCLRRLVVHHGRFMNLDHASNSSISSHCHAWTAYRRLLWEKIPETIRPARSFAHKDELSRYCCIHMAVCV